MVYIREMKNFLFLSALSVLASCNLAVLGTPYNKVEEVPKTPDTSVNADTGVNLYKNLPCDMEVGSGSGQVAVSTAIIGTNKVICIKAGTYSSLDVFGLTGVGTPIVVQNSGMVTFTDRIYLSNLKNVVVSGSGTDGLEQGIMVRDNGYRGTSLYGKFHTFTLQNIAYKNVPDYVISWDRPRVIYDGTPESTMYNAKFLRLTGENIGPLIMLYPSRETLEDILMNIEVGYNTVKNSPNSGSSIVLNAAFNVNVHHNRFENVSMNINEHSGIIFLNGDGKVHHNYFSNVLGNSMRTWPLSLKNGSTIGKLDMYNNITVGSIKYGMIEVQPFADHIHSGTTYTDIRIYHNTAGNLNHGVALPAGPALWTAGLVDLYGSIGGTIDIQNNLLFNVNNPRDNTYFINGQGYWPTEKMTFLNNLYFSSSTDAGLINLTSVKPSPSSPVVSKGSVLSLVPDDYFGVTRSTSNADLGAVTH